MAWRDWLLRRLQPPPSDRGQLLARLRELHRETPLLGKKEMKMIDGVLRMGEWEIRDVMIARSDLVGLRLGDDYQKATSTVCEFKHSRYPVFGRDDETVKGVLLAKDLLKYVGRADAFSLDEVMRAPVFEPLSKRLDTLLDDFQKHRSHMVIAVDEYELPAGAVTIEDVLERIVGEIEDEFDDEGDSSAATTDGERVINGAMSVEEFNAAFNAALPDDGADTVAGWLAAKMGHMPKAGERHAAHDFVFEVARADERRIYKLKVTAPSDPPPR